MSKKFNPYEFGLVVEPRTVWRCELQQPVVHEHRTDGTVITHINPSGRKSTLHLDLLDTVLSDPYLHS
jgi:hypothetical protein